MRVDSRPPTGCVIECSEEVEVEVCAWEVVEVDDVGDETLASGLCAACSEHLCVQQGAEATCAAEEAGAAGV